MTSQSIAPLSQNQPEEGFAELVEQLHQRLSQDDDPHLPYTPYLRAVHSKTHGYAQRVPGSITDRLHDFLSRHEFNVFLIFDWDKETFKNIREQFVVPTALTLAVAEIEKIPHPTFQGKPAPMSVDFMLTLVRGGWKGIDFKEQKDKARPRTRGKLRVMERTLAEAGVPHEVMTEDEIPATVVRNYRFLRILTLPFDPPPLPPAEMEMLSQPLRELLAAGRMPIFDAAIEIASYTRISAANIARACYWLIANRSWRVDFRRPIGPDYPVQFIR